MASDALAVAFAIAFLVSNVYASKNIENIYSDVDNYGNPNNTTSFTWQDLRNKINQGDAITYELGTPQYQILNADEPLEIITPDQPGYHESLKRYEQAAKKTNVKIPKEIPAEKMTLSTDSTTAAPVETKEKPAKDKKEEKLIQPRDKKIRFIIFKSKKKSKNSKILVPKNKQQEYSGVESLKNDVPEMAVEKSKLTQKSTGTQQILRDKQSGAKEVLPLQNSFRANNQKQSSAMRTITATEATKLYETTPRSIIENIKTNSPITYDDQMIMKALSQVEAMPTASIPIQIPLTRAPIVQPFPRPNGIPSTFPRVEPMEAYATGVSSNHPFYPAPPHITDFEYLYRSALGLN